MYFYHSLKESVMVIVNNMAEEALFKISGGRILDVATGGGGFITYLIENLHDYGEITAIDHNERALEAARKSHCMENIHFRCMDAARMDFTESTFDTVCIANSLHHMADVSGVLSEMVRVCKPGGHFIVCEMYRDGQSETQLSHVWLHHWWAAVDHAEGITHYETFTRQHILDLIGKIDLNSLEYYDEKDLESDPRDAKLIRELDNIIDRTIQRCQTLNGGEELCRRGEVLRQRIHEIGFQGATSLMMIGHKSLR
jgi:ubiquinone/menaquinone biosynthesis C-methylase UbiE